MPNGLFDTRIIDYFVIDRGGAPDSTEVLLDQGLQVERQSPKNGTNTTAEDNLALAA